MIRKVWRLLPLRALGSLREALRELPIRLQDAVPDLLDQFTRGGAALPPARLRRKVALSGGRKAFLAIGEDASRNVADIFEAARDASADYPRWLDFGCGPGRVSRHMAGRREVCELWGADVDAEAIAWAAALRVHAFRRGAPAPMADRTASNPAIRGTPDRLHPCAEPLGVFGPTWRRRIGSGCSPGAFSSRLAPVPSARTAPSTRRITS